MSTQKPKSHDDESLNFDKLEKELYAAVDADKRYWRENDAKFRAVGQKVESYEEFQDIVKASHLKPLEKGDNLNNIVFDQPWNSHAIKMKNAAPLKSTGSNLHKTDNLPKNGQEFARDWRRHHKTVEGQYDFLLSIGGARLEEIFKTEISFGLLGDILTALCSGFSNSDSTAILAIVEGLSSANRFSLSVQFLSSKEKQVCSDLFQKLQLSIESQTEADGKHIQDRLKELEKIYELKSK
ncbi:coiled-coil domain-containing protein 103-like [Ylistrum balloti]|uniref:coiled-coil domain-containing protein 103-like n=1 Tax=Ylistrum balloti TaxID=509963 RepID=UPI002905CDC6|nr:coiled-coil domain-containing protein 103-like [Ylistrum balloti]